MRRTTVIILILLLTWTGTFTSLADEGQTQVNAGLYEYDIMDLAAGSTGALVAVGGGGIALVSVDGSRWTRIHTGAEQKLNGVTWGDNGFVAVGDGGTLLLSTDGSSWLRVKSPTGVDLQDCAWNGKQYAVVGFDGTVLVSSTGVEWQRVRLSTGESLFGVEWTANQYIATGGNSSILRSEDGITWERILSQHPSSTILADAAHNVKSHIAVGDHTSILLSPDGRNWGRLETPIDDPHRVLQAGDTPGIRDVTWGSGQFVAVGQSGLLLSSYDGINWRALPRSTRNNLNGIVWNGKQYTVVGDEGTLLSSRDGENWESLTRLSARAREWEMTEGDMLEDVFRLEFPDGSTLTDISRMSFSSSDSSTAAISPAGVITAVGGGTAIIKALHDESELEITVRITGRQVPENTGSTSEEPQQQPGTGRNFTWLIVSVISGGLLIVSVVLLFILAIGKKKA